MGLKETTADFAAATNTASVVGNPHSGNVVFLDGSRLQTSDDAKHADKPATICFPFAGGIMGGSHISALKLIQSLDQHEFQPLIVLHDDKGQFGDFLRSEGIPYELAPTERLIAPVSALRHLSELAAMPRLIAVLARFLKDRDVRIVHSNEGAMHVTWGLPAKIAGARFLWHHRSSPRAKGLRYLAPWLADRVVSVSRFAAPPSGLISAARKCTVVHSPFDTENAATNMVDRAASRAMAITELGLSEDTNIFGFFGNFDERKRPFLFVEAIAALCHKAAGKPIMGLLFGGTLKPGLDTEIMDISVRLGIADRIRLMGFRYPSTPWMAACDALVVTAVEEPFGRTLIEAMLARTPVIAANSGGNPEAIRHGETGLLVPPDDAASFADAMLRLIRNPTLASLISDNAWQEARTRFGIGLHSQSIARIYRQLLTGAA